MKCGGGGGGGEGIGCVCVRESSDRYRVHSIIIPVQCVCSLLVLCFLMCVAAPTTPPNGE